MKQNSKILSILLFFLVVFLPIPPVSAQPNDVLSPDAGINNGFVDAEKGNNQFLSRGEVVAQVLQTFDLRGREKNLLGACLTHLQDCFFVFSAMSRFDGISLEPMMLYPDVTVGYRYYDDINTATMLGLVHGYIDEKGSPFYPRASMRRIEALKVVLGAEHLMDWKERFELRATLGDDGLAGQKTVFDDVSGADPQQWWYPRYVNFALEAGIVDAEQFFRPDDFITQPELDTMMQRAEKFLGSQKH